MQNLIPDTIFMIKTVRNGIQINFFQKLSLKSAFYMKIGRKLRFRRSRTEKTRKKARKKSESETKTRKTRKNEKSYEKINID